MVTTGGMGMLHSLFLYVCGPFLPAGVIFHKFVHILPAAVSTACLHYFIVNFILRWPGSHLMQQALVLFSSQICNIGSIHIGSTR